MKKSPDPIDSHVGHRLRLRRLALNMTQDQLGRELGLTFQQIQKYETGENRLSAGRLFRIAEILRMPVQFFFDDIKDAPAPSSAGADITEMQDLLQAVASPEGFALNHAYWRIRDPVIRKALLELIRTMAETP